MKRYFTALGVRCWVLGVGLYANAQQITNTNHPSPNTSVTTIVVTGDILLDRGVRKVIEKHGVDHLFSDGIDSVFRSAQVVVGNLECPATKIQSPVQKLFIFRGEPEWLRTLRQHGITHLNLANNHAIDQGREGLIDTRRNIEEAGIVPIGAGQNMHEAAQPTFGWCHRYVLHLRTTHICPTSHALVRSLWTHC